jgi:diacylglycerol kinase family enzyme
VDNFFATEMEVETRRHAVRLSVDGEVVPTESPIRYRYDPDALHVVAPPPSPPKEVVAS